MKKAIILILIIGVGALAVWLVVQFRSERTTSESAPRVEAPVDVDAVRTKAEGGDAAAQAKLGSLYAKGQGVTNSYAQAAKWFRLAAEQGNAEAQAGLGELYEAGQGVPKDFSQALKLYRLAADKGNAGAQYTMGFLFEAGRGVPQNQAEATRWFRLAAEQGDPLSQYDLGQRYDLGVGAPVDHVEALKWLDLAAAQGQKDSAARYDQVKSKMSREEISEAKRRAASFGKKKNSSGSQ
jgi:TPR repeat protein